MTNAIEFPADSEWGSLSDGTYYKVDSHTLFNYGERWEYGYIVGTITVMEIPAWLLIRDEYVAKAIASIPDRTLFGIWQDPNSLTTFVDIVEHVDIKSDAIALARESEQECIWDMREHKTIEIDY